MNKPIIFHDFGFKLCVVDELMYEKELVAPFCIREFARLHKARQINLESEGHELIPEALQWFKHLEVPESLCPNINRLYQNGNRVYHEIWPQWDGECDFFNVKSQQDIKHFPNLTSATLFYDGGGENGIVNRFIKAGVSAEYL